MTNSPGSNPRTGSCFSREQRGCGLTASDRSSAHEFTRSTLVKLNCLTLPKPGKGLVKHYLEKVTGLSRPQITRLVKQYADTGYIK